MTKKQMKKTFAGKLRYAKENKKDMQLLSHLVGVGETWILDNGGNEIE